MWRCIFGRHILLGFVFVVGMVWAFGAERSGPAIELKNAVVALSVLMVISCVCAVLKSPVEARGGYDKGGRGGVVNVSWIYYVRPTYVGIDPEGPPICRNNTVRKS